MTRVVLSKADAVELAAVGIMMEQLRHHLRRPRCPRALGNGGEYEGVQANRSRGGGAASTDAGGIPTSFLGEW